MAWLRLLRLSNGPTALADVLMGLALAVGNALPALDICVAICVASLLIYHAGMVLNDALDAEVDKLERAERPVPSGLISQTTAWHTSIAMLIGGCLAACYASVRLNSWHTAVIALGLAVVVYLYDGPLKKTALAPLLMGICRGLNVMLGLSPMLLVGDLGAIVPGTVLYVTGLTWVARQEATQAKRSYLAGGALLSLSGLAWMAAAPWVTEFGRFPHAEPTAWWLLWGVISLMIGRHYLTALIWPKPKTIQRAIGGAIQGIILIDTALAAGYVGPYWGMTILLMLPLTMIAARFIPQT